jgi:integrase
MPIKPTEGGGWEVSVCVSRQRVHRRLPPGTPKSEAKQLEAELRSALARSRAPVIPGDPRLTEVMVLYIAHTKTLRSPETAKHHANRIGLWAEKYRASQTKECVRHIVKDMTGAYAPATINRSLGALQKGLSLAWNEGRTPVDYSTLVKRLPENNRRTVYLSMEQVKVIADRASENVRAAIWIALLTGCRRGEVCKIKPDDIGADTIKLQAGNTKTLRYREVPIVPALRPWLKYLPLAINFEGVKSGFRRAREASDMPHVHFHDLRHSCATILLGLGVDLYVVRDILGHTSIKTTERYTHTQVAPQRAGLEKLGALHQSLHQKAKRPPKGPLSA